ncbi:Holo-[acyl-carrier-protein] synthase [Candidatus Westeberhardia cardiocondylae]|uniref:Holo-[acyl-carrier-protein] synthase n=1 Tax=Candidatus Westeberhardia cardiocondylae TaxID=1594731 RepID=A0A0H5C552_9ENTR|nr:holo-ACP synthase [Candidatus Westeberhardia cardiocondylae]CEN32091.1 Holo-[acyl-carrier-protein] synthase [Candidatus Westeberhardia cardiocondylae]
MAIIGIGSDIIEIKHISTIISRVGDKFAKRILSINEWKQYKKNKTKTHFLAKRLAAKEATSKALGTGFRGGLTFSQIEIFNDHLGKPYLHLFFNAKKIAKKLGVVNTHVTLTDERYYSFSVVILEN